MARNNTTRLLGALALLALLVSVGFGVAEAAKAASLSDAQASAVQQISTYFNKMKTMQGEFTQVGPKGHVSAGVFYISKPGRLRFEYAPPNPFLVVADGSWVTIKNNAKNTADQYPLSATPLRLVLADRVDLLKEADVKSVEAADGLTRVTVEDKSKLVPGHLELVFDSQKDELQQWIIVDGQGRRTTISLMNIQADTKPDPKLFVVELPDREKRTSK
ncbi:MAG: outer membrane lipoprotein carrier protein LolA [Parvibaculaceae bacterium]